jgi:hypothetical protein
MTLTLRQLLAYDEFNTRLDRIARADDLWVVATGAQCDGKTISEQLKELSD